MRSFDAMRRQFGEGWTALGGATERNPDGTYFLRIAYQRRTTKRGRPEFRTIEIGRTAAQARLGPAIQELRKLCNAEIGRIERRGAERTPGFAAINGLLRACDKVFARASEQGMIPPIRKRNGGHSDGKA